MSNEASGLGFGQFVPGFEFLQKLVNPAASAGAGGGMPNLGSWVAPTFNVEDLEKRIEELKAVQFWLEQNSKALSATIQAMEVQKMTLATLRDLNVGFADVARASEAAAESASKGFAGFEMPAEPPPPPHAVEEETPPPEEEKAAAPAPAGAAQDKVDPMQWWGALQQQFQTIAVNAMQDLAKQNVPAAAKKSAATRAAAKAKPKAKPKAKAAPARKKASPARKTTAAKKAPARKAPARKAPSRTRSR